MFFWIAIAVGLILLVGAALFVGMRTWTRPPDGVVDSSDYINERRRADHGNYGRGPRLHTGSDREA